MPAPKSLIIDSPFVCPARHWVESSANSRTLEIVFGIWCCDVAFEPAQITDFLQRHSVTAK